MMGAYVDTDEKEEMEKEGRRGNCQHCTEKGKWQKLWLRVIGTQGQVLMQNVSSAKGTNSPSSHWPSGVLSALHSPVPPCCLRWASQGLGGRARG